MGNGDVHNKLNKLNVMLPVLGVMIALIEPAFAGVVSTPAPIVGAGLPALAILGGDTG